MDLRHVVVDRRHLGPSETRAMCAFLDHVGYDPTKVRAVRLIPNRLLGGLDIEVEQLGEPVDEPGDQAPAPAVPQLEIIGL